MSRIRSIHPGLWTDEAFMALSPHARLLIIGIWTEAHDDGVFEWKPLTLKARIFPVDGVDVSALLDELVAGNFVRREEAGGRQVGLVRNFRQFQRPKKPNSSGLLDPEWGTYVGVSDTSTEPVPHQYGTGSEKPPQMEDGVVGSKKEEPNGSLSETKISDAKARRSRKSYSPEFEEAWQAYPTDPNMSKTEAYTAWSKLPPEDRPKVAAGIPGFVAYCRANPDYRPIHMVGFIRKRRFEGYLESTTPPRMASVEEWQKRLGWARQRKVWSTPEWGPAPMTEGCLVPRELLEPSDGDGWSEWRSSAA